MTPAAIIRQATAEGVSLILTTAGTVKAKGEQALIDRWLPILREQKPGILAALEKAVNDSANDPGPRHWWRLTLRDARTMEVGHYPAESLAEVLARYPAAVSAEPFEPQPRAPERPLTPEEQYDLRSWCNEIGGADTREVLHLCETDADARDYCLGRAEKI